MKKLLIEERESYNPIETSIENIRRKYDLDLCQTFDLLYKYLKKKSDGNDNFKRSIIEDLTCVLFD